MSSSRPHAQAVYSLLPAFRFLDRFYVHMDKIAGYLAVAEPGPCDTYPDLDLIPNPSFFLRAERFWKRTRATKGKGLIKDHSIGIYRAKLRARALTRN